MLIKDRYTKLPKAFEVLLQPACASETEARPRKGRIQVTKCFFFTQELERAFCESKSLFYLYLLILTAEMSNVHLFGLVTPPSPLCSDMF